MFVFVGLSSLCEPWHRYPGDFVRGTLGFHVHQTASKAFIGWFVAGLSLCDLKQNRNDMYYRHQILVILLVLVIHFKRCCRYDLRVVKSEHKSEIWKFNNQKSSMQKSGISETVIECLTFTK